MNVTDVNLPVDILLFKVMVQNRPKVSALDIVNFLSLYSVYKDSVTKFMVCIADTCTTDVTMKLNYLILMRSSFVSFHIS